MSPGRLLLGALLLAAVSACDGPQPERPLPPLPALATVRVAAAGTEAGRAWDGVLEAVQQADLTAQTGGRIAEVLADVDDRVAAGAVLLRLSAIEQRAGADTARAQLKLAEANLQEAEATYARYSALASKQFVSRLQLDQVRAARDAALAARDAAKAQLSQAGQQTEYTVVRAPFAGVISARRVEPGESVAPGQPLLSLYAPGAMRIQVQVPQSEAQAIRRANAARIVLADGRSVDALAVTVFPAADPATHSVGVRVTLPELEGASQPGATARVVFPIAGGSGAALQIPRSALLQRGEISGVYVLAEDRLSLRQLRLGRVAGEQVEVLAGLREGETIAADPVAASQALSARRKAAQRGDE